MGLVPPSLAEMLSRTVSRRSRSMAVLEKGGGQRSFLPGHCVLEMRLAPSFKREGVGGKGGGGRMELKM